jgi:predicted aldo/keto reductase-like oxidoreductase
MKDGAIDIEQFTEMVDLFMAAGFRYFDTAFAYNNGDSERAAKTALIDRYPRDSFVFATKLPAWIAKSREEAQQMFYTSLERTGAGYFDFYLLHNVGDTRTAAFDKFGIWDFLAERKKEGLIKHLGFSFHDKADVLDRILTEYPEIEAVQMQFNYVDYEDPSVESRKVYEMAVKHGKPVIVMEPVKGGCLVKLPEEAQKVFDALHGGSNASYALRFAAGFDNMMMVLSGMSTIEQLKENVSFMTDPKKLTEEETVAVNKVREIFASMGMIPCTACHYCVLDNDCPKKIQIPELFSCYNLKTTFHSWNTDYYYKNILTRDHGKASDCLKCGKCEKICPQHLPIRKLLEHVAEEFEQA